MMKVLSVILAVVWSFPAYADNAFSPIGPTVTLAVTTTTARAQYQATPTAPNVRIYNAGTVVAFVACGDATVVATVAAGLPIAPNGGVSIIGCAQTNIAAIK